MPGSTEVPEQRIEFLPATSWEKKNLLSPVKELQNIFKAVGMGYLYRISRSKQPEPHSSRNTQHSISKFHLFYLHGFMIEKKGTDL